MVLLIRILQPYQYVVGESSDVPLDQCWVVSCFSLAICCPAAHGCREGQVQLVFYSTSEPMVLPGGGPMEAMGVQKLY